MLNELTKLRNKHTWLKRNSLFLYKSPKHYEKLLPNYNFDGKGDKEYLDSWLNMNHPNIGNVLELMCGSGRMTQVLNKYANDIVGVDKSSQMLKVAMGRFKNAHNIHFVSSDVDTYIDKIIKTAEISTFDSIVSFWGINYWLHNGFLRFDHHGKLIQALTPGEIEIAEKLAIAKLKRLLENAKSGSRFVFFHVRSDTEEQSIHRKYWGKMNSIFAPPLKTPSQIVIEKVLSELYKDGKLTYEIKYVNGSVKFYNLEMALEIFMNFHSKGYFNDRPECIDLLKEFTKDLSIHKLPNGEIELGAGFLLMDILRK